MQNSSGFLVSSQKEKVGKDREELQLDAGALLNHLGGD